MTIRKVLIANRGEIAVRVIRTLREMGIVSVAVYSEVDRAALHVRLADEAYPIGPAASAESYLRVDRVLEACAKSGADAVHPGYGFLSESADFVRACQAQGVTFIGPDPHAMEVMGDKVSARAAMVAAGVPVVPGATGDTVEGLTSQADELGYPIMVKASAGGGGKGMRLVHEPDALAAAIERAKSEARSAFGNDEVYIEKGIVRPRHIEIQVLADGQGQAVHLFERDCSIQRRHQKVVEETPGPASVLTGEMVEEMGSVAVRAAEAVKYRGAGTVEFLLGEDGDFYFLEMNTRLQVEHPITEAITGLDLVREQVRIAAGEPLGYVQADIERHGHAIECRIYAEDPATGFLPSPGHIEVLRVPAGPGVRDDSGVYQGAEVQRYYDPLLSKLSVWAPTRPLAIARMRRALSEYVVTGIRTNLPFHLALMSHPDFIAGQYDTGFIDQHRAALHTAGQAIDPEALALAVAIADVMSPEGAPTNGSPARTGDGISAWRRAMWEA